jgi:hypothetical protein
MSNDTRLTVDIDQDSLPPITVGLYKAFLSKGKRGLDAHAVYQHLLFTYRLQHTDTVRADNAYIAKGLGMGTRRVKAAKNLLRSMNLIGTVRRHAEKGRFVSTFTRLNLLPNPGPTMGAESAPMAEISIPTMGAVIARVDTTRKCLKKESKCLKKESAGVPAAVKQASPHPFVTSLYFEKYNGRLGSKPTWTGKDGALLKTDLARLGPDKLAAAVRLFFDSPPRSVADFIVKAGCSYGVLHSQLPKLEEVLGKEERRLRLLKTCKACGKASETTGIDCPKCGEPDAFKTREAANA